MIFRETDIINANSVVDDISKAAAWSIYWTFWEIQLYYAIPDSPAERVARARPNVLPFGDRYRSGCSIKFLPNEIVNYVIFINLSVGHKAAF